MRSFRSFPFHLRVAQSLEPREKRFERRKLPRAIEGERQIHPFSIPAEALSADCVAVLLLTARKRFSAIGCKRGRSATVRFLLWKCSLGSGSFVKPVDPHIVNKQSARECSAERDRTAKVTADRNIDQQIERMVEDPGRAELRVMWCST
jgi:hypothetical protein